MSAAREPARRCTKTCGELPSFTGLTVSRYAATIAPHSARKIYAVQDYHAHHDIKRVQRLLNHSDEAVAMLYALADQLAKK